ncbi:MAG: DEAD/DEAH box helicase, partial [Dermatophilaceae bacterium]
SLPGDDGWVSLHLAETAHLTLAAPSEELDLTDLHHQVLEALAGGGAFFFRTLSDAVAGTDDQELTAVLWDLLWAGRVTNDTLAPLRALLLGGRTAHKPRRSAPRSTRYGGRPTSLGALSGRRLPTGRAAMPARSGPPTAAGRWSLLPEIEPDVTVRSYAAAEVLLDRYGVVTRGSVVAEGVSGGFAGVYRVLAAAEESGRVRRGYFVEGLGAAQFATVGAVDRLRAQSRPLPDGPAPSGGGGNGHSPSVVLAASDPANPYGAALGWPERGAEPKSERGDTEPGPNEAEGTRAGAIEPGDTKPGPRSGHQPGRKAGALVVLVDGALILYVERGGKTLLSWTDDPASLQSAADALALTVREGALGKITVEKADGDPVLGSDHPLAAALAGAGFHATPRGLRLRR